MQKLSKEKYENWENFEFWGISTSINNGKSGNSKYMNLKSKVVFKPDFKRCWDGCNMKSFSFIFIFQNIVNYMEMKLNK